MPVGKKAEVAKVGDLILVLLAKGKGGTRRVLDRFDGEDGRGGRDGGGVFTGAVIADEDAVVPLIANVG